MNSDSGHSGGAFACGERLYLRAVLETDADGAYHRWMHDPLVTRYLESRFRPYSIEALKAYVRQMQQDGNSLFLAIVLNEGDRHVGNIKIGPINWIHRFADVGLLIGERDCWGRGYASEAIGVVTNLAFRTLNLHRLTAGCYATNEGSRKAFLKAGWAQEGVRRAHFFSDGSYVDEYLLGIVRSEVRVDA